MWCHPVLYNRKNSTESCVSVTLSILYDWMSVSTLNWHFINFFFLSKTTTRPTMLSFAGTHIKTPNFFKCYQWILILARVRRLVQLYTGSNRKRLKKWHHIFIVLFAAFKGTLLTYQLRNKSLWWALKWCVCTAFLHHHSDKTRPNFKFRIIWFTVNNTVPEDFNPIHIQQ